MLAEPQTQNAIMDIPPMAQLARKMASIMGQLKRLNQAGVNEAQKWTFTSIDDITDAIRALMAEHGIALFSKMLKATEEKRGKEGNITRATVDMEFELVCTDTGVSKTMTWTGSADDHSDKALNKAAVYAEKFWLKSTFLVSTGKDPDAKSPGMNKRAEQPRQQQRQPEPPKPVASGRQVDMTTGEVLSNGTKPTEAPAPKPAVCLKSDPECQKRFKALCNELNVLSDEPYIKALGLKERYSEYPGTFDELVQRMRDLHEAFNAPEPDPVADEPVTEVDAPALDIPGKPGEAALTAPEVKNLLNHQTGSSTRATPFTRGLDTLKEQQEQQYAAALNGSLDEAAERQIEWGD